MNKLNNSEPYLNKHNLLIVSGLILLAALGLRFHDIGSLSAWYDEVGSLTYYGAQNDFRTALTNSHLDLFPPVYNMLLWIQFNIFGSSIETGRLLSCFFGFGSVILFGILGSIYSNRWVGFFLMLVAATHPYFIYYSREMRPYSALLFLTLLSYYLLILSQRKNSPKLALLWAFSLALAFNTHIIAITILTHQIFRITFDSRFRFIRWQKKALIFLAVLSIYPAYLIYLASQQAFSQNNWGWIGSNSLLERLQAAASVWIGYSGLAYILLITVATSALIYLLKPKLALKYHRENWLFADSLIILSAGALLDILCYKHFTDKYYLPVFALLLVGLFGFMSNLIESEKNKKIILALCSLYFLANTVYRFQWHPINENYKVLILKAVDSIPQKSVVFLSPHAEGLNEYSKAIAPTIHIIKSGDSANLSEAFIITDNIEYLNQLYPELTPQMHLADPKHFRLWCNF